MLTARRIRRSLLLVLLIVLLCAAWVAFRAFQVQRDLQSATNDASAVQFALDHGDDRAGDAALQRLRKHVDAAADRSSGPTWGLLTHVPVYGDDARGIRLVSNTLADLTRNGIAPLTATANQLNNLLPRQGRVDVDQLAKLQVPVKLAQGAFAQADQELEGTDPSTFVRPLRERYADLLMRIHVVSRQLDEAGTALQIMPSLLGADGPRNYLLVFQNNAEVRATGGLPGAVSLVHAQDGRLTLVRQVAGNSFGELPKPVLPLTRDERAIYGVQLGTFFLDANFTPDFPRTAELMRARWELDNPEKIDGVFSLDPVTLSYILRATGPITVDHVVLSADNAVDELLHGVYLRLRKPAEQDQYFQRVAKTLFDRVLTGTEQPETLLRALARGVREHRVYMHSFDPTEEKALDGRSLAGALVTDPKADPQVGFYVNDATGAKMSYYLRFGVKVEATACHSGRQFLTAESTLLSQAPADAASQPEYVTGGGAYGTEPGAQLDILRILGPVGGTITDMRLDGKRLDFEAHTQQGRPVAVVVVYLDPMKQAHLAWSMTTGASQAGNVDVSVTPGVDPVDKSSTVTSACD